MICDTLATGLLCFPWKVTVKQEQLTDCTSVVKMRRKSFLYLSREHCRPSYNVSVVFHPILTTIETCRQILTKIPQRMILRNLV